MSTLTPLAAADPSAHSAHERDAHEFLLQFRGRNGRRKRRSADQSRRDASASSGGGSAGSSGGSIDEESGSAWLASAMLLCLPDAHGAERLFAAQTLLHRLRRFKLVEAVDAEMESPEVSDVGVSGEEARTMYC